MTVTTETTRLGAPVTLCAACSAMAAREGTIMGETQYGLHLGVCLACEDECWDPETGSWGWWD